MSLRKTEYYTTGGPIKFISFNEFLQMVPVNELGDNAVLAEWNALKSYAAPFGSLTEDVATYERKAAYIAARSEDDLKSDLVHGVRISRRFKKDIRWMLEEVVVDCVIEFGSPTVAVRLGQRTWAVVNPEDFRLYRNRRGTALACHKPNHNLVVVVDRETEENVVNLIKTKFPEFSPEEILKKLGNV